MSFFSTISTSYTHIFLLLFSILLKKYIYFKMKVFCTIFFFEISAYGKLCVLQNIFFLLIHEVKESNEEKYFLYSEDSKFFFRNWMERRMVNEEFNLNPIRWWFFWLGINFPICWGLDAETLCVLFGGEELIKFSGNLNGQEP